MHTDDETPRKGDGGHLPNRYLSTNSMFMLAWVGSEGGLRIKHMKCYVLFSFLNLEDKDAVHDYQ